MKKTFALILGYEPVWNRRTDRRAKRVMRPTE